MARRIRALFVGPFRADLGVEFGAREASPLVAPAPCPAVPKTISHAVQPESWDHLGIVPGQVIRVCGMRRSGNHAIIRWLQRNASTGKSVFLNNCQPSNNPMKAFRAIEVNAKRAAAAPNQGNLSSATKPAGDSALFLFSYEDVLSTDFTGQRRLSGDLDERLIDADVVIYRSFLNWSASLLKKIQSNPGYSLSQRMSVIFKAFSTYNELLNRLDKPANRPRIVPICYDTWVASETNRTDILSDLNLPVRDNSLGPVQKYGGGSSFQKDAKSSKELQTDKRWIEMSGDPEYRAILFLASRDAALVDQVARAFPQDGARLREIAAQNHLPLGELS